MSNHTPGPYALREITKGRLAGHLEIHPPDQPQIEGSGLATVNTLHENARATAALFRASPDLLAALKALVERFGPPGGWDDPGTRAELCAAEAAIAKAEGEP